MSATWISIAEIWQWKLPISGMLSPSKGRWKGKDFIPGLSKEATEMAQRIIGLFVVIFATWGLTKGICFPAMATELVIGITLTLTKEII